MSRTYRVKRKTNEKVRDGTDQYASRSCRHHGSCSYCLGNRQFNLRKLTQEKLYEGDTHGFQE
jgi:hypothetical protein